MNRRLGPRGPQLPESIAFHEPSLQADEVRHGLILNALLQAGAARLSDFSYWTLGKPGECAIKMGIHSIVLGAVDEDQCRILAEVTARIDYPGVIGPELTARWFTDRARKLGLEFLEPELIGLERRLMKCDELREVRPAWPETIVHSVLIRFTPKVTNCRIGPRFT